MAVFSFKGVFPVRFLGLDSDAYRRLYTEVLFRKASATPFSMGPWAQHFRVETSEHRFIKLNKYENRLSLSLRDLTFYCWKIAPLHVYFSALNWLFQERVGKKYKRNVDQMRLVVVSNTLIGSTGLVCSYIGGKKIWKG